MVDITKVNESKGTDLFGGILAVLVGISFAGFLIYDGLHQENKAREFCENEKMEYDGRDGSITFCEKEGNYTAYYFKKPWKCRLDDGIKVVTHSKYAALTGHSKIMGTISTNYVQLDINRNEEICKIDIETTKGDTITLSEAWVKKR